MRMDQSDNGKQPKCHHHSARCLSTIRRIFLRDKQTNTDHLRFQSTDKLQIITQGIYGLLIAFITLTQIGIMGGSADLSLIKGALYLAACLPRGILCWMSGASQGKAAAASIGLVAKRPEQFGKAMIFPAMVETYAILALLISILSIFGIAGLNI